MKAQILICRSQEGIPLAKKLMSERAFDQVLSDDFGVRDALGQYSPCACSHLHELGSFYEAAPEVRQIIGKIDRWLASLDSSIPPEVLHWGIHVEGGRTSQRVQDALLLLKSYERMLERYEPSSIALVSDGRFQLEDDVLSEFLRHRRIPLHRYTHSFIAYTCGALIEKWRPVLSLIRTVWRLLAGKLTSDVVRHSSHQAKRLFARDIAVFQLCSFDGEHVGNVSSLMASLQSCSSITPVALTWTVSGSGWAPARLQLLMDIQLPIIRQEWFVNLMDLAKCIGLAFRLLLRASQSVDRGLDGAHNGTPLASLLRASLAYSLIVHAPERFLFYKSFCRFMASRKLLAYKPWGGNGLFEGKLATRLVRELNPDAVIFNYWAGAVGQHWPYAELDSRYHPDLFFCKGQHEKNICIAERGLSNDKTVIVGHPRFDCARKITLDDQSVYAAREALGLPLGCVVYVAVDPGCNLIGYQTVSEQIGRISSICELAKCFASICFVVKPHPSYAIPHLMPLIEKTKLKNVIVLDGSVSANALLVAVDIVISKYSTILLEAVLMGRPTISVLFDGDIRFKVFGDMPEVFLRREDFVGHMKNILSDQNSLKNWIASRLCHQSKYLQGEFYLDCGETSSDRAAKQLVQMIRERHDLCLNKRSLASVCAAAPCL